MTAITFDTLKYANTLEAAGIPRAQAQAQVSVLAEVIQDQVKSAADNDKAIMRVEARLERFESRMEASLADLRHKINAKFVQLEQRMIIKLSALMVVAVGVVAAIVKL